MQNMFAKNDAAEAAAEVAAGSIEGKGSQLSSIEDCDIHADKLHIEESPSSNGNKSSLKIDMETVEKHVEAGLPPLVELTISDQQRQGKVGNHSVYETVDQVERPIVPGIVEDELGSRC